MENNFWFSKTFLRKFRQFIEGNLLQAAPEEGQAAQPPAEVSPRGFEKLHDGIAIKDNEKQRHVIEP